MGSPVRGLRPVDALRLATEKVPNPTSRTSSPPERALVMASNTPSTAPDASFFESPLEAATALISSFLFILKPPYSHSQPACPRCAPKGRRMGLFVTHCQRQIALNGADLRHLIAFADAIARLSPVLQIG